MNTIEKNEIQGYLKIKRKMFWADRYAEIKDQTFFYYKNKGDLSARKTFQLSEAYVQIKKQFPNDKLIVLTMKGQKKNNTLQMKAENDYEHNRWFDCFQKNTENVRNSIIYAKETEPAKIFEQEKIEKEPTIPKSDWVDPTLMQKKTSSDIASKVKKFILDKENEMVLINSLSNLQLFCSNRHDDEKKNFLENFPKVLENNIAKIGVPLFFGVMSIGIVFFSAFLLILLKLASFWAYFAALIFTVLILIGTPFLLKSSKKQKNLMKIKATSMFSCNINEILLTISKIEVRKEWFKSIRIVEKRGNFYEIKYTDGTVESLKQSIYKEGSNLIVAEFDKNDIARVFVIKINKSFNMHQVLFYAKAKTANLKKINSQSNPQILYGLWNFILEKRYEIDSFLLTYALKNNIINEWTWGQNIDLIKSEFIDKVEFDSEDENEKKKASLIENLGKKINDEEEEEKIDEKEEKSQFSNSKINQIPEKYQSYYADVQEAMKKFKEISSLDSFSWNYYDTKEDVKMHLYEDKEKGVTWTRGEGIINKSAHEINQFLHDLEAKKSYDKMYDSGKVLEIVNDEFNINYQKFKGMFPVGPRDFILAANTEIVDNGSIYIVGTIMKLILIATSVIYPDQPEIKKVTRAWLYLGGWFLQPINENKTNLIYITIMDPKGSIPKKIVEISAKTQSMCIAGIRKQLYK